MKPQDMRSLLLSVFDSMTKDHNMKAFVAATAPSFVMHGVAGDMNLQQFVAYMETGFKGLPDMKFEAHRTVVEGDLLGVWYSVSGTHKGEFRGIPATGKKIKYLAALFTRSSGDKIVEGWFITDSLGIMQQMGVIPAPGKK